MEKFFNRNKSHYLNTRYHVDIPITFICNGTAHLKIRMPIELFVAILFMFLLDLTDDLPNLLVPPVPCLRILTGQVQCLLAMAPVVQDQ